MFVLSASAGLMIIGTSPSSPRTRPTWTNGGSVLIAILAIFNTSGALVSGFLSDRIGRTNTMILAFVLQAINMFAFIHYTTPALLIFGAAFTGLCYGTIFTLFPAATADFYGVRNLGVNYGLVFTAFGVAGVTGPMLGGRIRDAFGSYHNAFTISAIMLLARRGAGLPPEGPEPEAAQLAASPVDEAKAQRKARQSRSRAALSVLSISRPPPGELARRGVGVLESCDVGVPDYPARHCSQLLLPLTSPPASGRCCDTRCRCGRLAGRSGRAASHRTTRRRRCSPGSAGCQ